MHNEINVLHLERMRALGTCMLLSVRPVIWHHSLIRFQIASKLQICMHNVHVWKTRYRQNGSYITYYFHHDCGPRLTFLFNQ